MSGIAANNRAPLVLLTGATGYVGGKLLPLLEQRGRVRCLTRNPDGLQHRASRSTQVVAGDVLDPESLRRAMEGVEIAYYLVHSMGTAGDFEQKDRQAAEHFAEAAAASRVKRIIYLGGLGGEAGLSPHLRSRQEVGRILRSGAVETIEFRAAVVIGAGSLSFRLISSLTERLPVMICPRWLATPTQPIAIHDLLEYLVAAAEIPNAESRIFEIGGRDVVSYGDMIREYARQRGLRRLLIRVPVLTPYLSSLWLGLVTPATAEVGRHLIEGVRNPTVVTDAKALAAFPNIRPMGIADAIRAALNEPDGG